LIIPALGSTKPAHHLQRRRLAQPDGSSDDTNPLLDAKRQPVDNGHVAEALRQGLEHENTSQPPFWRVPLRRAGPASHAESRESALVQSSRAWIDHIPIDREMLLHVIAVREPDAVLSGFSRPVCWLRSESRAFGQRDLDLGREQEIARSVRLGGILLAIGPAIVRKCESPPSFG